MDPLLTMPFAASPDASALRPSRSVINADDDGPERLDSPSEARTLLQRRGVVIHRMLERLAGSRTRSSVEKKLRDEFSDWPTTEEFNAWWQEACDVVDDPGLSDLFAPDRCRMARNEVPILYREADRDDFGIIDRLVIRETEILVIDYKTHPQANPESIGQLAENFTEQMRRYGTGVRRLWPQKKLRLILLFTACRRIVELTP